MSQYKGPIADTTKLTAIVIWTNNRSHMIFSLCAENSCVWVTQVSFTCRWSLYERDRGPLHTRDWEPMTSTLQALSSVGKAEPVRVRFTLRLRDQWSMWMQGGCEVYMDPNVASNGSCFMVTWTSFKNHLLEVGLTQNWPEIMALRTLTTVGLFYFIMCEDLHE